MIKSGDKVSITSGVTGTLAIFQGLSFNHYTGSVEVIVSSLDGGEAKAIPIQCAGNVRRIEAWGDSQP